MYEEVAKWMREDIIGDKIYPREAGIYRQLIGDEIDLMMYIKEKNYVDCYLSIFSNWQIRRRFYDVIFLDIDGHNGCDLECAEKRLRSVLDILGKDGCRIYFSGRGYHVYYVFPMIRLEHYGYVVKKWIKDCGVIDYVDRNVIGDYKRLARIPLTVNSKVGSKVVCIADYGGYCSWWKELLELEQEVSEKSEWCEKDDEYVVSVGKDLGLDELPLCMRQGIETLIKTGELEHLWRLAISIFLLKVWGKGRVEELFRMFADDYKERMTRYQLNWIERNNYKCFSCRKMWELGICPFRDMRRCAWYKLTDGWLERVVVEWK